MCFHLLITAVSEKGNTRTPVDSEIDCLSIHYSYLKKYFFVLKVGFTFRAIIGVALS